MEMMGKVVSVNDGIAKLEVRRNGGCGGGCSSCASSCSDASIEIIDVINTLQAEAGDIVEIKADSSRVLKYMMILYGIPLLFLLIGSIGGYLYFGNTVSEFIPLLVGIIAMVIGFIIVKIVDSKSNLSSEQINTMTRKF